MGKTPPSKKEKQVTPKKETKEKPKKNQNKSDDIILRVGELIKQAVSETMYPWLEGFDSPGPVPRDAAYYRLLYLLAKELKLESMVELGTCEGVSAMCMAEGNPEGMVHTMDVHDKVDPRCKRNNVGYLIGDALKDGIEGVTDIQLLYIDIVHTPEAMEKAFEIWTSGMTSGAIVIMDGVLWKGASEKMPEWWENFNPEGFGKTTHVELHSLEGAGSGVLIKL